MTLQFSRIGLERANTAEKAVDVITELLEKYGQGGSCMEDECSFTYHNSFLISDRKEAWLLETSGKHWAAERVEGNQKKNNMNRCLFKIQGNEMYLRKSENTLQLESARLFFNEYGYIGICLYVG